MVPAASRVVVRVRVLINRLIRAGEGPLDQVLRGSQECVGAGDVVAEQNRGGR